MEMITPVTVTNASNAGKEQRKDENDYSSLQEVKAEGVAQGVIFVGEGEEMHVAERRSDRASEGHADDNAGGRMRNEGDRNTKKNSTEEAVDGGLAEAPSAAGSEDPGKAEEHEKFANETVEEESAKKNGKERESAEQGGKSDDEEEAQEEEGGDQQTDVEKGDGLRSEEHEKPGVLNESSAEAGAQPQKRKRGRPLKLDADGVPLRDKREKEKAEKRAAKTLGDGKSAEKPRKPRVETSGTPKRLGRPPKLQTVGTPSRVSDQEEKATSPERPPEHKQEDLDLTSPDILPASAKRKRAPPQRLTDEEPLTSPKRAQKTDKRSESAKPEKADTVAMPKRGRGRPRKVVQEVSGGTGSGAAQPVKKRGRPLKKAQSSESSDEQDEADEGEGDEPDVPFGKSVGKRRSRSAKYHADGTPLLEKRSPPSKEEALEAEEAKKEDGGSVDDKEDSKKGKESTEDHEESVQPADDVNSGKRSRSEPLDEGERKTTKEDEAKEATSQPAVSMGRRRGRPPKNKSEPSLVSSAPAEVAAAAPAEVLEDLSTESAPADPTELPAKAPAEVSSEAPARVTSKPAAASVGSSAGPLPVRTSSARRKAARPQQAAC